MKRLVIGVMVAAFAVLGLASPVVAAPAETAVTGVVTENHVPVAGATVSVLCNGKTEFDTTDAAGSYLVHFVSADCPFGTTVKVTATKGGKSGVASDTVRGMTTKLNLAIVNVSIPEYGLIGMLVAGGVGVGVIAYMRRRQQAQLEI
ncbi:MAG TPA: hypothetical protein VFT87_03470 [Candidatus Saccharimonadales bacterium]|nr:hypothetical protein [Candidatus Saccharimonadales bacterium]